MMKVQENCEQQMMKCRK